MEMAKVRGKGQINIPIAVCKPLNLNVGDNVLFMKDGGGVRMLNASSLNLDKKEGGRSRRQGVSMARKRKRTDNPGQLSLFDIMAWHIENIRTEDIQADL